MGILNESAVMTALTFVAWTVIFYVVHGVGITLGYHRLLTHRSLQVPRWLMYLIVSAGYFAGMGSPIVWVGVHRLHHQKSDEDGDPHSPRDGFKHALYGWMSKMYDYQSDEELQKQAADLMQDPVLRLLGTTHSPYQAILCAVLWVVFRLVLLALFGPVIFFASLVGSVGIFWSTQLVNAVCHQPDKGYRSYKTTEGSRNVWWVGLLACGEGWHNNHHAMPKSARHGIAWWEFDITWCTIWVLEKIGLAKNVVRPHEMVLARKKQALIEELANATSAIPSMLKEPVAEPVFAKKQ